MTPEGNTSESPTVSLEVTDEDQKRRQLAHQIKVHMCPDVCHPDGCSRDVVYAVARLGDLEFRVRVAGNGTVVGDRVAAISQAFRGVLDAAMGAQ